MLPRTSGIAHSLLAVGLVSLACAHSTPSSVLPSPCIGKDTDYTYADTVRGVRPPRAVEIIPPSFAIVSHDEQRPPPHSVVKVRALVDARGVVVRDSIEVEPADESNYQVRSALRSWTFRPAW